MEIRIATEEDLPALVPIQRETQDLHVRLFPKYYRSATDAELQQSMKELLAAEQTKVWIALTEGSAAGFLIFKIDAVPENPFCYARKDGLIDQLAVRARFQRRGIGQALMAEAERYAASQGCTELRLAVLVTNNAARIFYDRLGFVETFKRLRKAL